MEAATDWRDTFCGRQEELNSLVSLYEKVAAGQGPRLAVVLGDRGMGKTRLVQEFYRVLATRFDPDDYWPDASLFSGNNLRVAPELSDAAVRAHYAGFTLASRPMPFLWWGFRLSDPDVRNASRSDLASHRATLELHLKPVQFAREVAAARAKLHHAGVDAASEIGKNLLKAAVQAIPGFSLAATVVDAVLDYGGKAWDAKKARSEEEDLRAKHAQINLLHADTEREDDLHERTLDEIAAVLAPSGGAAPLPVVVFCDDAQFSGEGGDVGARHLLTALWERACLAGWPLLLVLTHWAVDWHRASTTATSLAGKLARDVQSSQFGLLLDLPKESTLGKLVIAGLPDLPEVDVQLLIDKADGNPQVLIELVGLVRRSPAWRKRDGGALTLHARAEIERRPTELAKLILDRLESDVTPHSVRQAVALSSVQGMEFLRLLTDLTSEAMQLGSTSESLAAAEYPHRLVVGVNAGVAGFVQRAYREAALQLIGGHLGDPDEVERFLLNSAVALVQDAPRWTVLEKGEQASTWGVLIGLAQDHSDSAIRLYAGKGLLWLIANALSSEYGADSARAAELANRFEQGLPTRWQLADFPIEDVLPAMRALRRWHGSERASGLANQLVDQARKRAAAEATPAALQTMSARLQDACNAAQERGDWNEAGILAQEALDIRRELAVNVGTPESRSDLASSLQSVGDVLKAQGEWRKAEVLYAESLELFGKIADQSTSPDARRDLSTAIHKVAGVSLQRGDTDAADRGFQSSLAICREVLAEQDSPKNQRDLAVASYHVGWMARKMGDWARAEDMYHEALALLRKLAERLGTPESRRDVAAALSEIGDIAENRGNSDKALASFQESLEITRQLADRLGTAISRRDLAVALQRVGKWATAHGRFEEADKACVECLQISRVLADRIGTPSSRQELSAALCTSAELARRQGDWVRVQALHGENLSLSRSLDALLSTPGSKADLASALSNIGHVALVQGDVDGGQRLYRESLEVFREVASRVQALESLDSVATTLATLGFIARMKGDWDDADLSDKESLSIRRELADKMDTPNAQRAVATSLTAIGETARSRGNWKDAEAAYLQSLAICQTQARRSPSADTQWSVAASLCDLALVARNREDWDEAERLYQESLEIRRALHTEVDTPDGLRDVGVSIYFLGELAQAQSKWIRAEALYRECLEICRHLADKVDVPESRRDLAGTLKRVGEVAQAQGDLSGAEAAYRESLVILRELATTVNTGEAQCDVAESLRLMAGLAHERGELAQARQLLDEGKHLFDKFGTLVRAQEAETERQGFQVLMERLRKAEDLQRSSSSGSEGAQAST